MFILHFTWKKKKKINFEKWKCNQDLSLLWFAVENHDLLDLFCLEIIFWKTMWIWGYGALPAVQPGFGPAAYWDPTCSMQWVLISQQRYCHQGRMASFSIYARFKISLSSITFPCLSLEPMGTFILSLYVYLPADLPSWFCEAAGQQPETRSSSELLEMPGLSAACLLVSSAWQHDLSPKTRPPFPTSSGWHL